MHDDRMDANPTAHVSAPTGADALRRAAWQRVRPVGPIVQLGPDWHGWEAGSDAADAAIDGGAGVLLIIDAAPPTDVARAVTALYCGGDASTVTPDGGDDLAWMRTCSTVRDTMARLRPLLGNPGPLLADDPRLAAITSAIARAAARRTPVVLAGATALIAALCAQRVAAASAPWMFALLAADDRAAELALKRLGMSPWGRLDWAATVGTMTAVAHLLVHDLDGAPAPSGA